MKIELQPQHNNIVELRPAIKTVRNLQDDKLLYFNSDDYFQDLFKDIELSKQSIEIEMFIWTNERVGTRIFHLLSLAVQRGVEVRIVIDGIGSIYWLKENILRASVAGIQLKIFHRFIFNLNVFRFSTKNILAAFTRLNRRNHRKLFIIDNSIAYTGSLNVMDAALDWKEAGIRITGTSVPLLRELFEDTWMLTDHSNIDKRASSFNALQNKILASSNVRCNQSFSLRRYFKSDLLSRIHGSKNRVWLMTPYFIPSAFFLHTLRRAAKRKIDVRIILPFRSDVRFIRWVTSLYYRYLLSSGIKIYEYKPKILHAKMMIIDNWGSIGSSNLNSRSSFLDLELDIGLTDIDNIAQLEKQFLEDMVVSDIIVKYKSMSSWKYILAKLLYRLRAWF